MQRILVPVVMRNHWERGLFWFSFLARCSFSLKLLTDLLRGCRHWHDLLLSPGRKNLHDLLHSCCVMRLGWTVAGTCTISS